MTTITDVDREAGRRYALETYRYHDPEFLAEVAEEFAGAVAQGRGEARARVAAILDLPEAQGRLHAATVIACETDMPPAAAAKVLAATPREDAADPLAFLREPAASAPPARCAPMASTPAGRRAAEARAQHCCARESKRDRMTARAGCGENYPRDSSVFRISRIPLSLL